MDATRETPLPRFADLIARQEGSQQRAQVARARDEATGSHAATCQADGARTHTCPYSIGTQQSASLPEERARSPIFAPNASRCRHCQRRGGLGPSGEGGVRVGQKLRSEGACFKRKTCRGWRPGEDSRCPRCHLMPLTSWALGQRISHTVRTYVRTYSIDWQFRPSCIATPADWEGAEKEEKSFPRRAEPSLPQTLPYLGTR